MIRTSFVVVGVVFLLLGVGGGVSTNLKSGIHSGDFVDSLFEGKFVIVTRQFDFYEYNVILSIRYIYRTSDHRV